MDILKVEKEIKEIASFINEDTKNVRLETNRLAKIFGEGFANPPYPVDIKDFDQRYIQKKQMVYLDDFQSEQGFKQIAATGAIPIDDNIREKLVLLEEFYPILSEVYQKYKHVDEVWYLDKQSVAGGNTGKNVLPRVEPGFDIGGEYEKGERPYSRFGIIGPEENPGKNSLWSPNVLIEIFDELVISAQAPVYGNNELIGKISIHYNLISLREDTVGKSNNNLLLISNHFTVIGLSQGAKEITHLTEYQKKAWDSKKAKMVYVDNDLNIEKHHQTFTNILRGLKPGETADCEFFGKKYQVLEAAIPEVGFQIVALV
jgi:hypothetical protein